jgi:hypothetical protein
MRKEVLATLKADPEATYDIVLGNWRHRRSQIIDEKEEARVAAIYRQERDAQQARRIQAAYRPWWRFW